MNVVDANRETVSLHRAPSARRTPPACSAWGVVVPDLAGCFSAGDTTDESIANTSEAITSWIEAVLDEGGDIPMPGAVESHRAKRDFKGWIWAFSEVDASVLSDKAERINTTLPARVLKRVDETAVRLHENRSGFLARAALAAIRLGGATR
jgi:predicted RNase H-like HicB family nuclease